MIQKQKQHEMDFSTADHEKGKGKAKGMKIVRAFICKSCLQWEPGNCMSFLAVAGNIIL